MLYLTFIYCFLSNIACYFASVSNFKSLKRRGFNKYKTCTYLYEEYLFKDQIIYCCFITEYYFIIIVKSYNLVLFLYLLINNLLHMNMNKNKLLNTLIFNSML